MSQEVIAKVRRFRFFQILHRSRELKAAGANWLQRRIWLDGYIHGHIDAYDKVKLIIGEGSLYEKH